MVRLFAILLWFLLSAACMNSHQVRTLLPMHPIETVTITAPRRVQVGEAVTVTVAVRPPLEGQSAVLTVQGAYGAWPMTAPLHQGRAQFILPSEQIRIAGEMAIAATVGQATAYHQLSIAPGAPVEPLLTLVGPRSIVADGADWSMLVAIAEDRYGNAVAAGTPMTVRALHPYTTQTVNDTLDILQTSTQYLLAWARIYSRTKAGHTIISAITPSSHSQEWMILEVPDEPTQFALHADPDTLVADGRQFLELSTDPIVDKHGNLLLDGTLVTFVVQGDTSIERSLWTTLLEGRAYVALQAPQTPKTVTIQAFILNTVSRPLQITFTPDGAVAPIPLAVFKHADTVELRAGPMLGAIKQYIPDGTVVSFQIVPPAGSILTTTVQSDAGFATGLLRRSLFTNGQYKVTVIAGAAQGAVAFTLP